MRVVSLEGALVLDIEASQKDTLLEYFRRQVVSDDVRFEDLGSCGHVEVHGPLAADMASAVIGVDVRGLSADELATFAVDRHQTGYVTRLDTLGESGFAIWAVGNSLATIWASLLRVGTPPLGRDAYEVLRIEAGRPCSGVDMTEDTLALEVAPPESISFTKGCYRGQEVVARGAYAGRMNRRLLGLRIDGDVPPSRGDTVRVEGEDAGFVTSGCWSPTTGWIVALALLQVERVRIDSRLFIDRSGWDLRASLHSLPFVLSRA
jgi:folate-binding protein YgfZ